MKKMSILLVSFFFGFIGHVQAQCNGANITNVSVTNSGNTYNYSYNWQYLNGNASIAVVLKCNGAVVAQAACNSDLKEKSGNNSTLVFTETGSISYPSACSGLKEIEFRVHASKNCNGNFCTPSLVVLPVNLVSFEAKRTNALVSLKWQTASERNNSGFAIERNTDGTWKQVAFMPTQAVGGTSDLLLSYQYTDNFMSKGIAQYRLRQVDMDQKATYSAVRIIRGDGQTNKVIVAPNPSKGESVAVSFSDGTVVLSATLVNAVGKTLQTWNKPNSNSLSISGLHTGMYFLKITTDTGVMTEKIVVSN